MFRLATERWTAGFHPAGFRHLTSRWAGRSATGVAKQWNAGSATRWWEVQHEPQESMETVPRLHRGDLIRAYLIVAPATTQCVAGVEAVTLARRQVVSY